MKRGVWLVLAGLAVLLAAGIHACVKLRDVGVW